jgi:hypothetical protein
MSAGRAGATMCCTFEGRLKMKKSSGYLLLAVRLCSPAHTLHSRAVMLVKIEKEVVEVH